MTGVIAFLCAIAGVYAGRALMPPEKPHESEIHALLHDHLTLDATQRASLDELEKRFAIQREGLEHALRTGNVRIADAIRAEHDNGPRVTAAVDASHRTMGELQKATLAHVFAMRRILHPDQVEQFDRTVIHSLTADPR